jgi:hypothetical protein
MRRRVYNESTETWQREVETFDPNLDGNAEHFRAAAHSIGERIMGGIRPGVVHSSQPAHSERVLTIRSA